MTRDEIIEMARQAGMDYLQYISPEAFEKVEAFAKLVAEHERDNLIDAAMKAAEKGIDTAIALEREACAKIADTAEPYKSADLIRARGQA